MSSYSPRRDSNTRCFNHKQPVRLVFTFTKTNIFYSNLYRCILKFFFSDDWILNIKNNMNIFKNFFTDIRISYFITIFWKWIFSMTKSTTQTFNQIKKTLLFSLCLLGCFSCTRAHRTFAKSYFSIFSGSQIWSSNSREIIY